MLARIYAVLQPILPKKFDENEWYTLFISGLMVLVFVYIYRRNDVLLKTEIVFILLLNLLFTTVGDYFLAMPPYDFYDTVDRNSGEIADILLQNIVYPIPVCVMVYYYQKLMPNVVLFIILCASMLLCLEWISVKYFHLFSYNTWKLWYSYLFYVLTMWLNLFFFQKFHLFVIQLRKQKA
jgi:hypothetical protein